jgi:hypothetical protein
VSIAELAHEWAIARRRPKFPPAQRAIRRTFGSAPTDVAVARRFARVTAARWEIDSDPVELVVGELAENAVQHARTGFSVTLTITGRTLRVDVADGNSSPPYIEDTCLFSDRGRGLVMIEQAAFRWGFTVAVSGGKKVWADLEV